MNNLIEALKIFFKYTQDEYPLRCEHETLFVNVSPEDVSSDDIEKLEELGFEKNEETDEFISYTYGSY